MENQSTRTSDLFCLCAFAPSRLCVNCRIQVQRRTATRPIFRATDFAFSIFAAKGYDARMALVRILVDGYSLLHSWPELAPGKPRHSAAARDELIYILTRYHDAIGTPITIFFDGGGAPAGTPKDESVRHVEVLFSRAGQTADEMIERDAHRF